MHVSDRELTVAILCFSNFSHFCNNSLGNHGFFHSDHVEYDQVSAHCIWSSASSSNMIALLLLLLLCIQCPRFFLILARCSGPSDMQSISFDCSFWRLTVKLPPIPSSRYQVDVCGFWGRTMEVPGRDRKCYESLVKTINSTDSLVKQQVFWWFSTFAYKTAGFL